MTEFTELFAALAKPFDEDTEVKCRKGPGDRLLKYVTARTVMNRLDNVLGPENWWDDYIQLESSVVCVLSMRLPDGRVLTKQDAGARSQTGDEGVDDMGAHSDGLKRAAVKFGIGRYLYCDGIPDFAMSPEEAQRWGILLHRVRGHPDVMGRPVGAAVGMELASLRESPAVQVNSPDPRSPNAVPAGRQPVTGKELWGWAERMGTATGEDVVGMVLAWGKDRGKSRVVDWDIGLVSECFADTAGKLDQKGMIEIPAEARGQMPPPSDGAAPHKAVGPMTIHPKDPLLKQKLRVVSIARELSGRVLGKGVAPSEVQAMAWLDVQVVGMGYPAMKDLRNYSDRKNLLIVVSQLERILAVSDQLS
jgi:hypothetical protein